MGRGGEAQARDFEGSPCLGQGPHGAYLEQGRGWEGRKDKLG